MIRIQDCNSGYVFREKDIIGIRDLNWDGPPYSFTLFTIGGTIELVYESKDRAINAYNAIREVLR